MSEGLGYPISELSFQEQIQYPWADPKCFLLSFERVFSEASSSVENAFPPNFPRLLLVGEILLLLDQIPSSWRGSISPNPILALHLTSTFPPSLLIPLLHFLLSTFNALSIIFCWLWTSWFPQQVNSVRAMSQQGHWPPNNAEGQSRKPFYR